VNDIAKLVAIAGLGAGVSLIPYGHAEFREVPPEPEETGRDRAAKRLAAARAQHPETVEVVTRQQRRHAERQAFKRLPRS
jgi:hypothetical protein